MKLHWATVTAPLWEAADSDHGMFSGKDLPHLSHDETGTCQRDFNQYGSLFLDSGSSGAVSASGSLTFPIRHQTCEVLPLLRNDKLFGLWKTTGISYLC